MTRARLVALAVFGVFALAAVGCTPPGDGGGSTPPVAVIGTDTLTGAAPLTVHFTSASSSGTITARAWNFGDPSSASNTASTTTATHTYNATGIYLVTLELTGGAGQHSTAHVNIVVPSAANPVAISSPLDNSSSPVTTPTFSGVAGDASGDAP